MSEGGNVLSATQQQKAEAFRALHEGVPFVIPNPWDAGSARVMENLGFKALATTSGGFAFTLGREDGEVGLEELTGHVAALDRATSLPVSVDLENGFGPAPEDAATAIVRAAAAGAVGGSIEDHGHEDGIYALDHAVERVAAAAEAGAQRVSVGSSLAWVAVEAMAGAAERIRDEGDFSVLRISGAHRLSQ